MDGGKIVLLDQAYAQDGKWTFDKGEWHVSKDCLPQSRKEFGEFIRQFNETEWPEGMKEYWHFDGHWWSIDDSAPEQAEKEFQEFNAISMAIDMPRGWEEYWYFDKENDCWGIRDDAPEWAKEEHRRHFDRTPDENGIVTII